MRDYDPTTGRYIQADPLGLVDGASVYGYVGQNPGRYVDPRGETILDYLFRPANDNKPPSCEGERPAQCTLTMQLDEFGQRSRGLGGQYPNGKLCIYQCPYGYRKIEYHAK